jgi:hypothetical protein
MSELLTVSQVAEVLKVSEETVVRRFEKVRGVVDLGASDSRDKRRYRVLRIPKTVVEKYLVEKSGRPVKVEVPVKAERRRKSETWEDKAVLNLAKAAKQNDCKDRKTFERIAGRARMLAAFVPESDWAVGMWLEEEQ